MFNLFKIKIELRKPSKKGVIRHRNLTSARERIRNGQLIITKDGLGTIKEYKPVYDEKEKLIVPHSVSVYVRNLKNKSRVYKLTECTVVDIIEAKSGDKYPAAESEYSLLLMNDAPVTFLVTRNKRAVLSNKSRKQMASCAIFAKKQNGIKVFNELNEKGIWNPTK
jgi:hypothetical protein